MAGPRADRPAWQAESGNQLMLWALPQFPGAMFMRALNLSGLNSREILSSTSGGPKSELQGSTELPFSKAAREGWVPGHSVVPGAHGPKAPVFTWWSSCVSVFPPFSKVTCHWTGAHPDDIMLINHLQNPFVKSGHIRKDWG